MLTKKELGKWGEETLDLWMIQQGFQPYVRNQYFRGGEIDRIYIRGGHLSQHNTTEFCLAEIKVATITSVHEVPSLLTEVGVKRFIKPSQLLNLLKISQKLQRQGKVFIRLFVLVRLATTDSTNFLPFSVLPAKICHKNAAFWILSLTPEYIHDKQAYGGLSVRIPEHWLV